MSVWLQTAPSDPQQQMGQSESLMMIQSSRSLPADALVAARAINVLCQESPMVEKAFPDRIDALLQRDLVNPSA